MPPPTRIPVIVGPTAGGKTALAIEVAREFERRGLGAGEVVSADAFQVYRHMDIGTGKATPAERQGVPHHLLDILEPDDPEPFSVARWLELAERTIADIRSRAHTPILVGGTHLYIKSFLEGMFDGPGADEDLRAALRTLTPDALRAELERVDPDAAARIHPNDQRRTIRALEVFRLTGTPISEHQSQWDRGARADALLFGLDWPTALINPRINARVKAMMDGGFADEVRALLRDGKLGAQAREALGYKQLAAWLDAGGGPGALDQTVERIKIETRRFAKNQRTWLRRLRGITGSCWLDPTASDPGIMAQHIVSQCVATADPR